LRLLFHLSLLQRKRISPLLLLGAMLRLHLQLRPDQGLQHLRRDLTAGGGLLLSELGKEQGKIRIRHGCSLGHLDTS
jgi:hypothetical protein